MSAPTMTPMSPNAAATPSASASIDLPQNSDDSSPGARVHRQHSDDVGPVVASLVAVAHQSGGDRVAVGLVADQHATEVVPGFRVERREKSTELSVLGHGVPSHLGSRFRLR